MTSLEKFIELLPYNIPLFTIIGAIFAWLGKIWSTRLTGKYISDLENKRLISLDVLKKKMDYYCQIYEAFNDLRSTMHTWIIMSDEEKKEKGSYWFENFNINLKKYSNLLFEAEPYIDKNLSRNLRLYEISIRQIDHKTYNKILKSTSNPDYHEKQDYSECELKASAMIREAIQNI